jgi:Peptidase_C39 like family
MAKIKAIRKTVLKAKPIASSLLSAAELINIELGKELDLKFRAADRDQHDLIELAQPLVANDGKTKLSKGYIYYPHWAANSGNLFQALFVPKSTDKVLKLPVKWRTQVDNHEDDPPLGHWFGNGNRQCCLTSHTMLLGSIFGDKEIENRTRKAGFNQPEGWYGEILQRYGDTTDHDAQTAALDSLGIKSYWSTTLSMADALKQMEKGIGVVVGYAYKSSGHICMMAGYNRDRREVLTHDPYGSRAGAQDYYVMIGEGGEYDPYSMDVINQIWLDYQTDKSGWGRIITEVAGQPTGMGEGL